MAKSVALESIDEGGFFEDDTGVWYMKTDETTGITNKTPVRCMCYAVGDGTRYDFDPGMKVRKLTATFVRE